MQISGRAKIHPLDNILLSPFTSDPSPCGFVLCHLESVVLTSWERWCNLLLLYDIGCLLATQEPEGAGATLTFLQTTDMLSTVPTPTKQTPLLLTKSLSGLKTCEP